MEPALKGVYDLAHEATKKAYELSVQTGLRAMEANVIPDRVLRPACRFLMSQRLAMSKKETVEEQLQDLVSFAQCNHPQTLITKSSLLALNAFVFTEECAYMYMGESGSWPEGGLVCTVQRSSRCRSPSTQETLTSNTTSFPPNFSSSAWAST